MANGRRELDYKERWQEFYEQAIEEGASEREAGKSADARLADHTASLVDQARDYAKYANM